MITDKTVQEIAAIVRANHAKLNSCRRHDFTIPVDRSTKKPITVHEPFCYWQCQRCGGWVSGTDRKWYETGLEHAGRQVANSSTG